jgi:glycosyltransferase involved in cell wall biosynthesis
MRTEGQPKAEQIGRMPGVDLRVLVPHRWNHYGRDDQPAQPPEPGASFEMDIRRVWLRWAGPFTWHAHFYTGMAAAIREFKPDVIDLWEEAWGAVSAQAVWLRNRILPSARIVTETEQNIYKKLPFPFEQFRKYTLEHSDYAVARSEEAAEVLRSKGFGRPVEVVPNAVDDTLFHPPSQEDRDSARRELGFTGFTAGYIGRLVPEKGLTDLIDALPLCPEVTVIIVGSGPTLEELKQRAAKLDVTHRVRFLGALPLPALPKIMGAMDTLVLPSRTTPQWKEQFGRVIIEAHACATPTIGSDSGAIPKVVGGGGLIFPEGNSELLAAALMSLAADPARTRHLGQIGREQVERQYTTACVARQMAAIYSKVLPRHRSSDAPLFQGAGGLDTADRLTENPSATR